MSTPLGIPGAVIPAAAAGGVSVRDETVVVVASATILNFTNAELVTAPGGGQADIRVGFGRNKAVTLGTETTVAGAGHDATLRAGSGITAGMGGSVAILPGAGAGAGAKAGDILFESAAPGAGGGATRWVFDTSGGANPGTRATPDIGGSADLGAGSTAWNNVYGFGFIGPNTGAVVLQAGLPGAASPGTDVEIIAEAGVGPGVRAGGNISLNVGAGVGGGLPGEILVQTFGTSLNLRPTEDGLLDLGAVVGGVQYQIGNILTYGVQGRNGGLSINALRLTAGPGDTVFVFGGDASGAGNAGGDLELGPGTQGAGGTAGAVIFSTSGLGAYSVRPDVTNLVTLGATTIAFPTIYVRAARPDNNQALTLSTAQVAAGAGPAINVTASGAVTSGAGGSVNVTAGTAAGVNQNGGNIVLTPGAATGTGIAGTVQVSSQLVVAAGGTTAPAYTFTGDRDTGMWSSGANTIDFTAGGGANSRLQIDANAAAAETALLVGVAGAPAIRVSVGANDSGGAGFRVLRVPN